MIQLIIFLLFHLCVSISGQELQERSTITQPLPSCKHTLSMQVLEGYCTWLCVLLCVGVSLCYYFNGDMVHFLHSNRCSNSCYGMLLICNVWILKCPVHISWCHLLTVIAPSTIAVTLAHFFRNRGLYNFIWGIGRWCTIWNISQCKAVSYFFPSVSYSLSLALQLQHTAPIQVMEIPELVGTHAILRLAHVCILT